jgi:hypothetical protein
MSTLLMISFCIVAAATSGISTGGRKEPIFVDRAAAERHRLWRRCALEFEHERGFSVFSEVSY